MKVTIKDIAKMADVSTATVSKVVNNKDQNISSATRQRILDIIKEYNYVPNRIASSMITKKTHAIGLVIPDIANPFFPEIARGVEDVANRYGYHVILCNSDNDTHKEVDYIGMLQEKMVDGIILTASSRRRSDSFRIGHINVPLITVDRDIEGVDVKGKITVNNTSGAFEAVSHLFDRGYRNILHIAGPMSSRPSIKRYEGYRCAHDTFGVVLRKEFYFEGTFTSEWGYDAIQKAIEQNITFDGVFCGNDLIALGAVKALKEHRIRIPSEVGIVGFDNIYMSTMIEPQLTTVHQPNYAMGEKAASMLIDVIEGRKVKEMEEILDTKLIIRESTK